MEHEKWKKEANLGIEWLKGTSKNNIIVIEGLAIRSRDNTFIRSTFEQSEKYNYAVTLRKLEREEMRHFVSEMRDMSHKIYLIKKKLVKNKNKFKYITDLPNFYLFLIDRYRKTSNNNYSALFTNFFNSGPDILCNLTDLNTS